MVVELVIYITIVLVVILLSMTLHEAMHALVSYWLGDDTAERQGRLTLNPIKHIDPFLTILLPLVMAISGGPIFGGAKPVPFNPNRVKGREWGAALVAVSGPLTNLLIAFVTFGIGALTGVFSAAGTESGLWALVVSTTVSVNLGFFAFNMLPIPPLDGSRLLYALAPDFFRRFMDQIERLGILVIFIIVIVASPILSPILSSTINSLLQFFIWIFRVG